MLSRNKLWVSRWQVVWASFFTASLMLLGGIKVTQAQDAALEVVIDWPNEGEVFYSGPTSLLYNIPVQGRVKCSDCDLDTVSLQLELMQNGEVAGQEEGHLQGDGSFSFYLTVNPQNSDGNFGSVEGGSSPDLISCGGDCHFPTNLSFPKGPVQIKVIAIARDRTEAAATRDIIIDHSTYTSIPVYVHLVGQPEKAIDGVEVLASTRLYLWRERHATNSTDAQGKTMLQVEALSQANTDYVITVQPSIVDGVLYQGVAPAFVTLPPGTEGSGAIELAVTREQGEIRGSFSNNLIAAGLPSTVLAIDPNSGESIQAPVSEQGEFIFENVFIDKYLITVDQQDMIDQGVLIFSRAANLREQAQSRVELPGQLVEGQTLEGTLTDTEGTPLPFGWVQPASGSALQSVLPHNGMYTVHALPPEPIRLTITAPGYYSLESVVPPTEDEQTGPNFGLVRQPETARLAWGSGFIEFPAESQGEYEGLHFRLDRGWLWGQGRAEDALIIQVSGKLIEITQAHFALEYIPAQAAWFYLFEGQAQVRDETSGQVLSVAEGQMVNLANPSVLQAAAYDPVVKAALHPNADSLVALQFEPTPEELARDQTQDFAIRTGQVLALITYSIAVLVLIGGPLGLVAWWLRGRNQNADVETRE